MSGLIGLLTLCTWPTQAHAQDSKKELAPKDMAGTYVLDKERGLMLMQLTVAEVLKDEGVTVLVVTPILNVNLSKVNNAEVGITFLEPDVDQGIVLKKCTTFDVQWSKADDVFDIKGLDDKKKVLYKCRVKTGPKKGQDQKSDPSKKFDRV